MFFWNKFVFNLQKKMPSSGKTTLVYSFSVVYNDGNETIILILQVQVGMKNDSLDFLLSLLDDLVV